MAAGWQEQEPGYFRVALFDHHMPLCDGLAAARKIRVLEQENQIRV
jgi:CheY-like chemotaxis protein